MTVLKWLVRRSRYWELRGNAHAGMSHKSCRYELYSISKPATLDAYLGYPLLRYYKRKFRGASIAGVKKMLAPKDETADAAMRMWDTMKMG